MERPAFAVGAIAKLGRFILVGSLNTLFYCAVAVLAIDQLGMVPRWASVLGYVATIPVAFLAHRSFTFRSIGDPKFESMRFAATHLVGIAVSVLAMAAIVDGLGLHYLFGIALVSVLVPLISLVVMDKWVFPLQRVGSRPE